MEYINPEHRTTRKDLKRKRNYTLYKKGGSLRTKKRTLKTNEYNEDGQLPTNELVGL